MNTSTVDFFSDNSSKIENVHAMFNHLLYEVYSKKIIYKNNSCKFNIENDKDFTYKFLLHKRTYSELQSRFSLIKFVMASIMFKKLSNTVCLSTLKKIYYGGSRMQPYFATLSNNKELTYQDKNIVIELNNDMVGLLDTCIILAKSTGIDSREVHSYDMIVTWLENVKIHDNIRRL
jgi:hypothetical protein